MRGLLLTFVLSISLSSSCFAYDLDEIYNILKYVESNNNSEAIGDGGMAYGEMQIHKVCVDDINRIYHTDYTHKEAFDVVHSRDMFHLYISHGIRLFRKRYCREPTEEDIVRFWNGGIYKGYKNPKTVPYYRKYIKYKEQRC